MGLRSEIRRLTWRLGRRLYCLARSEPNPNLPLRNGEIDLARRIIAAASTKSDMIVIDVGANVGDWLRPVLDAFPQGSPSISRARVFAFEPVPATREMLARNVQAHARGAIVSIENFALSNAEGEARMTTFEATAGTHTLRTVGDPRQSELGSVLVRVTTLSAFASARGLAHIDLLKIDTEGFDRLVFEGARPLLAAERISVAQFEYNHRWVATRSFLKDVFDMLEGLPYSIVRLMPDHVEFIDGWHPEFERFFEANYAIVHRSSLNTQRVWRGRFDASNTYA